MAKRKTLRDELRYHYERYGVAEVCPSAHGYVIQVVPRAVGNHLPRASLCYPISGFEARWDERQAALDFLAEALADL